MRNIYFERNFSIRIHAHGLNSSPREQEQRMPADSITFNSACPQLATRKWFLLLSVSASVLSLDNIWHNPTKSVLISSQSRDNAWLRWMAVSSLAHAIITSQYYCYWNILPPSQINRHFDFFHVIFDHSSHLKNQCKYKK